MTTYPYYYYLSDEEVEERIAGLKGVRARVFANTEITTGDRRHALFVASSYPEDKEEIK